MMAEERKRLEEELAAVRSRVDMQEATLRGLESTVEEERSFRWALSSSVSNELASLIRQIQALEGDRPRVLENLTRIQALERFLAGAPSRLDRTKGGGDRVRELEDRVRELERFREGADSWRDCLNLLSEEMAEDLGALEKKVQELEARVQELEKGGDELATLLTNRFERLECELEGPSSRTRKGDGPLPGILERLRVLERELEVGSYGGDS